MTRLKRHRASWAVAISVAVHLAFGVVLLLQKPALLRPLADASGPPEAIIPVLILPRTPPQSHLNGRARPAPLRLHRRPQPFLPPDVHPAPIAPPVAAATAETTPQTARGAAVNHPAPLPEGPKGDVRTALRQGPVGCANVVAVGLTRAERDHCNEVLGKGAKDTAFAGLGLSAEKEKLLEAAGARKEADYRYKHDPDPAALPSTEPPGASAEALKRALGVPGHLATVPF